jgi:hypothetical protein
MPFVPSQANSYNVPSIQSKTVIVPPAQYGTVQFYYPPELLGYSQGYCPMRAKKLEVPGHNTHRVVKKKTGGGGSLVYGPENLPPKARSSSQPTTSIIIPAGQDVSQNMYRDVYDDAVIPKYRPVPIERVFVREAALTSGVKPKKIKKVKTSKHRRVKKSSKSKKGRGSISRRSAGMGTKLLGKKGYGTRLLGGGTKLLGRGTKLVGKRGRGTKLPGTLSY